MIHVPAPFAEPEGKGLFDLIERNPFATLVSFDAQEPWVSHLPFLLDRQRRVLRAHMARANPHWRMFSPGQNSLVIFHGPHHYVSPAWYAHHPSVPTWNYATVHVRGTPRLVSDPAELETMLFDLVRESEPRDNPWHPSLPREYLDGMLRGIVGFEIPIVDITGKFKLSQNRPADDQAHVVRALRAIGSDMAAGVAELMQARKETGSR
jgi:transcriptional regulator